jgi:hypothetical protein
MLATILVLLLQRSFRPKKKPLTEEVRLSHTRTGAAAVAAATPHLHTRLLTPCCC